MIAHPRNRLQKARAGPLQCFPGHPARHTLGASVTRAIYKDVAVRSDPIRMSEPDPGWAISFERERQLLTPVLEQWLVVPIEHMGSTAVPGLIAKPIIDMVAVVSDINAVGQALGPLREIGWVVAPEPGMDLQRRLESCTPSVEWRTHHLHVVESSNPDWRRWLAFRDYLRAHPEVADEYGRLKTTLANLHGSDGTSATRTGQASPTGYGRQRRGHCPPTTDNRSGVGAKLPATLAVRPISPGGRAIRVIIHVVACIFCDIVSGVAFAEFVARRDAASAFLPLPADRLAPLHTLVIPNRHSDDVTAATDADLTATMSLSRDIAKAMLQVIGADGVNLLNASGPHSEQSVFHLHIHVVPRWRGDGLRTWPAGRSRQQLSADALGTLTAFLAS
jgi:GrpB-like predicted nucleotidyltransferase (UPF0157 family)/diadenosine tetraphosphate (Ap4A) HIT family hydrolase